MSNHLHMVASAENGSLSDILRDFKKYTSKALIEAIEQEAESRRLCPPAVLLALLRRAGMLNLFWYAGKNDRKIKYYKVWQEAMMPRIFIQLPFWKKK